jgi:hypothetical protein
MESEVGYAVPRPLAHADCSAESPCGLLAAVAGNWRYVIPSGNFTEPLPIARTVSLQAEPGTASFSRMDKGAVLSISNATVDITVDMYGLEISGGAQIKTDGVFIQSSKVSLRRVTISNLSGRAVVANGSSLKLTQSLITGNEGGGVLISNSTFEIMNNLFAFNGLDGDTGSAFGAISISTPPSSDNRLDFNGLYENMAQTGVGSAIDCVAGAFTARNNILASENDSAVGPFISGSCSHEFTISPPRTLLPGTGNKSASTTALFVAPSASDFHVRRGSPALGAADPSSPLSGDAAQDLDGAPRTAPATIGPYQGGAATATTAR